MTWKSSSQREVGRKPGEWENKKAKCSKKERVSAESGATEATQGKNGELATQFSPWKSQVPLTSEMSKGSCEDGVGVRNE